MLAETIFSTDRLGYRARTLSATSVWNKVPAIASGLVPKRFNTCPDISPETIEAGNRLCTPGA